MAPSTTVSEEKGAQPQQEYRLLNRYFNGYYCTSTDNLKGARLSLTCSCLMDLTFYPLDVQLCDFDLISYAFTTKAGEFYSDRASKLVIICIFFCKNCLKIGIKIGIC